MANTDFDPQLFITEDDIPKGKERMTTETLDPETLESASARVNRILHPTPVPTMEMPIIGAIRPARAPRRDKGSHRPPKPAPVAPAGTLSAEQVAALKDLIDREMLTKTLADDAQRDWIEAREKRDAFIAALAAK